jgi:hypothetical protein
MALREYLPELGAETLEIESRAAEGQAGTVGALQASGQIRRGDRHGPSIRAPRLQRRRLILFTPGHQSI